MPAPVLSSIVDVTHFCRREESKFFLQFHNGDVLAPLFEEKAPAFKQTLQIQTYALPKI